ncbi:MAG: S-layer homology domain-containing protein, partial [Oscillospiraceae bacterium]|nr:S-layer homology domain-containing protein [Oscillospiraceae bacterium]
GYLLAYAQKPSRTIFDYYEINLAYIAKNSINKYVIGTANGLAESAFQVRQLTNASTSMGNPFLVPTSLSGGYILWTSGDETISYASYDANGQTGTVQTASGKLSDCQPIAYNGKVVWFTTEGSDSVATFYTLNASGVTATKANGTASAPSTPSSTPAPGPFKDVSATHWAAADIQTCVEKGMVKGYADGTFRPGNSITNAEFISMAAPIFVSQAYIDKAASELGSGAAWYLPVMHAADAMFGNSSIGWDPAGWPAVANKPITRTDAAIIGTYCFQSEGGPEHHGEAERMTDLQQLDGDTRMLIGDCLALGVMNGYPDNTFRPNGTLTRAEACAIVNRMARVYNS